MENVVRGVLREAGLKLGVPGRTAFAGRGRELTEGDARVTTLVEPLLAILATTLDQLARLTKQVQDIVRQEGVCRPADECSGRRSDYGARLSGDDRPAGPLQTIARRGAHLGLTPARARPTSKAKSAAVATSSPGPRSMRPPTLCWFAAGSGRPCGPGA